MIYPTTEHEALLAGEGLSAVGVDEVGRGPLVGPVVAAAALLRDPAILALTAAERIVRDARWRWVRDSKSVPEARREEILTFVQAQFVTAVGMCDHETIDRINILEASFLAMKKAVAALERAMAVDGYDSAATVLLVDGDKDIPNTTHAQRAIPGGDRDVLSIAAASLVAKVTRDRMMTAQHETYPLYGFDRHKGYGTAAHMDALRRYGPTPLHRRSFAPVHAILRDLRTYGVDI